MSRRTDYQPEYRRYLPHIQPPGATLFVTFRLAGSLPAAVIQQLWQEKRLRQREIEAMAIPDEMKLSLMYDEAKRGFGRFDVLLDKGDHGPQWLGEPPVASMVCGAMHDLDGRFYDLLAYCVMPNHVHLVMTPLPEAEDRYHSLAKIMQHLKGNTARCANQLLGRQGHFWQRESYDHYARDGREVARIVAYVLNNPVKAGLAAVGDGWRGGDCRPGYPIGRVGK